ncbi:MAG: DUF2975 domain-containing protein [Alphaproteobacteria bacterium]
MSEVFFLSGTPEEKKDRKNIITSLVINCLIIIMALVLIVHTSFAIIHHLSMARIINIPFPPPHIASFMKEPPRGDANMMPPANMPHEDVLPDDMPPPDEMLPDDMPPPDEMFHGSMGMPRPDFGRGDLRHKKFDRFNSDFMQKTMLLRISLLICHLLVGLGTLYVLKKLASGYQRREFFSARMVKNYALIGTGLIVLALISFAQSMLMFNTFNFNNIDISEQVFMMILDLWFKPYGILAVTGLHCLVLAVVMREGCRIFEEQSLTI